MKKILCVCICLITLVANSQTQRIPAYVIDTEGVKTQGFINSSTNYKTPSAINFYSSTEGNESVKITPQNAREVGLTNGDVKLISSATTIDLSNDEVLTNSSEIRTRESTIFLRQIIQGKADLYLHSNENNTRYYIKNDTSSIVLLPFKKYMTTDNVVKNVATYRAILNEYLKCNKNDFKVLSETSYNENDLKDYIQRYNDCQGSNSKIFKQRFNFKPFSATAMAGVGFSYANLDPTADRFDGFDDPSNTALRVGGIAEFSLDRINYTWSIIGELFYTAGSSTELSQEQIDGNVSGKITSFEYQSIDAMLGARTYLYANDKLSIFPGLSVGYKVSSGDSKIYAIDPSVNIVSDISNQFVVQPSVGIEFNRKVSAVAQYQFYTDTSFRNFGFDINLSTFNVMVGYRLF
ncbi:outer membrane beta-barrel protein [Nonlabens ponticola]|uniref:Outer membrane protein beta-barrel domain-containing protein n=1 Tax=Nonlabens ponticola TaxID=2496866 RepID=A0A3S9MXI5_9FLAO|nr:outer membrane beta-barrel protein [Nonlabens ponticola]AZQ43854.1 hypothetical protein EJ995_06285 [Nonlabens ponticola]